LAQVHALLSRCRVRVQWIRLSTRPAQISYDLDLCEADGSPVSGQRWAWLQGAVLDCVLSSTQHRATDTPRARKGLAGSAAGTASPARTGSPAGTGASAGTGAAAPEINGRTISVPRKRHARVSVQP
jgi:hypothetical protein